jgi:hypothetical protein
MTPRLAASGAAAFGDTRQLPTALPTHRGVHNHPTHHSFWVMTAQLEIFHPKGPTCVKIDL